MMNYEYKSNQKLSVWTEVAEVGPGEARIGLIALQLPQVNPNAKKTQPTVLKILFPIDRAGNLTATLVL